MKKEEIHWADWYRILMGPAPAEFLLEVFIRTILMYLVLLVVLRFLGKRMGGQLTISELAVMLTLGAIISVPMQVPDKGLLQGILVLIGALLFQRGITYLSVKYLKVERVTEGRESVLVKDGVLLYNKLHDLRISRDQMLAMLRNEKIYNLGEVRRVYLEACGLFSIFKFSEPKPGLALLPPGDADAATTFSTHTGIAVCNRCGTVAIPENDIRSACKNCSANEWTSAITSK
jgi:uncharacterized membrane protein YcaP (DUF421 family)